MDQTITKYRACAQKVLGGPHKLKPGQPRGAELKRVKKHHWSPSSIRYLGNIDTLIGNHIGNPSGLRPVRRAEETC